MPDFFQQPRDEDGPVFREPWEAQAFALVLVLHQERLFTWEEWATALHNAIVAAQRAGDPDSGDTYYAHWLSALEQLAVTKGMTSWDEFRQRKNAWLASYIYTPHGQPVELLREKS